MELSRKRRSRARLHALCLLGVSVSALYVAGGLTTKAAAQMVGDQITDPRTGDPLIITAISGGVALTDQDVVVILNTMAGDMFMTPDPANPSGPPLTFTVDMAIIDPTTMLPIQLLLTNGDTVDVATDFPREGAGDPGDTGSTLNIPGASGQNVFSSIARGPNGAGGNGGGGFLIFAFPAGDGSPGGRGPDINLTTVGAQLSSTVANVPGLTVASFGGNGGNGGNAVTVASIFPNGGDGGAAGAGGDVSVTNQRNIATSGNGSDGMLIQSLAGNGGSGGFSGGTGGVAGNGGPSANGGFAFGNNQADVRTDGIESHGVLVQSLGGNSGPGGVLVGLGGRGGGSAQAGDGGTAVARNEGNILTTGSGSNGLVAQSVGGDGGTSGLSASLFASLSNTAGAGGDGGSANALNAGVVETRGNGAIGVVAQSIGGGGGLGGSAVSAIFAMGSSGGAGGNGGSAQTVLEGTGSVRTAGFQSHGMLSQSIGGGGGNAGFGGGIVGLGASGAGGGTGGNVTAATDTGTSIFTGGDFSQGILAQSVGGGGGSGASGVGAIVAVGGSGGTASQGGDILVDSAGFISTTGVSSRGIFAQSVGGGGGVSFGSLSGVVTIGGRGGAGGNAGDVVANNRGTIQTSGVASDGIYAQSVGGGGGGAGFVFSGLLGIGGAGGAGGDGGRVDVLNAGGGITTQGDRARGIFAQSVGGGGGAGGAAVGSITVSGFGGIGGTGGDGDDDGGVVSVDNSGLIVTGGNAAHGIQAQSIGGGGGDGGLGIGIVTVGGSGSAGGSGGSVSVRHANSILTTGNDSHGLFAQSIGGGGGNGGSTGSFGLFFGAAIGGSGGGGGNGDRVDVDFDDFSPDGILAPTPAQIRTTGSHAKGVLAQSIGGGGGSGGGSTQVTVGLFGGASFAIGGTGGGQSTGGFVSVDGFADISTGLDPADPNFNPDALGSQGLVAQSIGGGGGNGGFATSIAAVVGFAGSVAASIGIGGTGAGGGDGGTVDVNSGGSIQTTYDFSEGLVAQSIGGGGGNGGFAVSVAASASTGAAASVGVGIGGSAGLGGQGGMVEVDYAGDILTLGQDSDGVVAQSIGGGGGSGGFNVSAALGVGQAGFSVPVGIGGRGGAGGRGSVVDAFLNGRIDTFGEQAQGFVAQSIGGGGGNGGFNVSAGLAVGSAAGIAVPIGLGGGGAAGGAGGNVTAGVDGILWTRGDQSGAFVAQSVGGGGGNGGFNVSAGISAASSGAGALAVGIGGAGGGGSNGGTVNANVTGMTQTDGFQSGGILAQSVGGGGGNGGFNVSAGIGVSSSISGALAVGVGGFGGDGGSGSSSVLTVDGSTLTNGDMSDAVVVQSIGGGGGNGAFNVSATGTASSSLAASLGVGVGGFGGVGGSSGAAEGTIAGDIMTMGDDSRGFVVQSLGGGGGNGGFNVTGGVALSSSAAGALGLGIGGFGDGGGNGSTATGRFAGSLNTAGDRSSGMIVQSLGGGGGNGGFNVTGNLALAQSAAGSAGVGVGGFAGTGGDAGAVVGEFDGDVVTAGDNAGALIFQSLGGGGGNGGFNVNGNIAFSKSASGVLGLGIGGFGGGGGNGSTVDGIVNGAVDTRGDNSGGVLAQSLGGQGGNGGMNVTGGVSFSTSGTVGASAGVGGFGGDGGDAAAVTLIRSGATTTEGGRSDGVVAQSIGGGGGRGGINVAGNFAVSTGSNAVSAALGLGGFGGGGGNAGDVNLSVDGNVIARGFVIEQFVSDDGLSDRRELVGGSNGIIAQSVGGSGGTGGLNVSGAVSLTKTGSGTFSGALALGVGGFGGSGGDAGVVGLDVDASVVAARGDGKAAVSAQSIGGGGGNGALNVAGGIAMDGTITGGVGGFGGDGGSGAAVNAVVVANIVAEGRSARGFVAQSIGGGGGTGAINVSAGIGVDESNAPSLSFGIGGFGGTGNISGAVDAEQLGNVTVTGVDSIGVLAQSVAGGGGAGGLNVSGNFSRSDGYTAAFGFGGNAGDGADAGSVSLRSNGRVSVMGQEVATPDIPDELPAEFLDQNAQANGILAQSIGGGGGQGGINVSGVITPSGNPFAIGIGGSGGGGGHAGSVHVTRGDVMASTLETTGNNAAGLTAQSIGGGGGQAGINAIASVSGLTGNSSNFNANIAIGGDGGATGDGGETRVDHFGDITTGGDKSIGLLAQSVGGGGGNANFNFGVGRNKGATALNFTLGGKPGDGGSGGEVLVNHQGMIATNGDGSSALVAQSIGGGGGNTATSTILNLATSQALTVNIGRTGGVGGSGGDVTVSSDGVLSTAGDNSSGVHAQSIGNGGGNSGAVSVGLSQSSGMGASAQANSFQMAVGLAGAQGGEAGNVVGNTSGLIMTEGDASHAVYAQSIGGGGGNGGMALNTIISQSNAGRIGIGGQGGEGGRSGTVDLINTANLQTMGDDANGIWAQSIGGGGGNGGAAFTVGAQLGDPPGNGSMTFSMNVGGTGGLGNISDAVTIQNTALVLTGGDRSHGIKAQSIGGGGGTGGMAATGTLSGGGDDQSLDVNIGGFGGTGATSGDVMVTNEGFIATQGESSAGIYAQSVGGGGGDAGLVIQALIPTPFATRQRVSLNIGGNGGEGGAAGDVSVINRPGTAALVDANGDPVDTGAIMTMGDNAYGMFAQSIGGGGGNGSSVISANFSGSSTGNSISAGLSLGGSGGDGNTGGDVTALNAGTISTMGSSAHGIFAQSIGGGGGNGGINLTANVVIGSDSLSPFIAIGGSGGGGGDGGDVVVTNDGMITTKGANAYGILAQSIGGGGGNAGMAITASIDPTVVLSNALAMVLGGTVQRGSGGAPGEVTVNQNGKIVVMGDGAQAVKVDAINGGGGALALDFSGVTSLPGVPFIPADFGAGADDESGIVFEIFSGGQGNENTSAANVNSTTNGMFVAMGQGTTGLGLQAIGGGGGDLDLDLNLGTFDPATDGLIGIDHTIGGIGGQGNMGGNITSTHVGMIATVGANAPAVILQTIGGGGGQSSISVDGTNAPIGPMSYTLGGDDGFGEMAGVISHQHTGDVSTDGDLSHGMMLQSIGGGGGSLSVMAENAGDADANVTLGGSSQGGGKAITNLFTGNIFTTGANAIGMLAQSIGGGGGEARINTIPFLNVILGGGGSGDGGTLTMTNAGSVSTSGENAHGVVLQSIGGGGGVLFTDADDVTLTLVADGQGSGGNIALDQQGDVLTTGDGAFGIVAQSLGGGGGLIDGTFAGSAGGVGGSGAIDLILGGNVVATGQGTTGVLAQSIGSAASGDINVTLATGQMIFASIGAAFEGGTDNLLTNNGMITTQDGLAGTIFTGTTGNDGFLNNGFTIGNLALGSGINNVTNSNTGTFITGASLDLGGPQSLFLNAGLITIGGTGLVQPSILNGAFEQTAGGEFEAELDFGTAPGILDAVFASGDAVVDGTFDVDLLNIPVIRPGNYTAPLVTSGTMLSNTGAALETDASVVITYALETVPQALNLVYNVDFIADGVEGNRIRLGDYINRVQTAGSDPSLADLITRLVTIPDLPTYADALTQLTPEVYAEQQAQSVIGMQRFSQSLVGCGERNGWTRRQSSDRCVWFGWDYTEADRDFDLGFPPVKHEGPSFFGGARYGIDGDTTVGFGLNQRSVRTNGFGGRWRSQTDALQLGVSLGFNRPFVQHAVQLTAGFAQHETDRLIDVTDSYVASSDRDTRFASLSYDVSRLFEGPRGWLRTSAELGVGYHHGSATDETGADELNLLVEDKSEFHSWLAPSLALGTNLELGDGLQLRPFGEIGYSVFLSNPESVVEARLQGAPQMVDVFAAESAFDTGHTLFGGGLQLITSGDASMSFAYRERRSENRETGSVTVNATVPF
ncbi:MAG: autotransporter outer membrane beta-barrel domain-containing protein [Pseudomonadota bacterium]